MLALGSQMLAGDPVIVPSLSCPDRDGDMQTLLGPNRSFGGFVGFGMKMTQINSQGALMSGGEINVILNRSVNIGFAGYGLLTDLNSVNTNDYGDPLYLEMGYGGLNIEPVLFSKSLVHFTVPVLLGAGGIAESRVRYFDSYDDPAYFDNDIYRSDFFLVIEPGVNAELNITRFMRVTGGISYRWVSDVQVPGMSASSLEGMSMNFGLRLGWF